MDLSREFLKNAGAVVLAIANALAPAPELTEPLNLDQDTAVVQMVLQRSHDSYNGRVSALYFEDSWKTTRANTLTDTYKTVNFNGHTFISGDRPPRRQYFTGKFVFTIPDSPKLT